MERVSMPNFAPIEITLYDENDAIKAKYTRSKLPWGIPKKAVQLSKSLGDVENISESDIDAIAGMVVEIFGDQFTVEDLDKSSDVSEMMTVIQSIVTRAGVLVQANPTLPLAGAKKK